MPSLQVNGTELNYAEAGVGGQPLLMVHGTLGDQRSFTAQMTPPRCGGLPCDGAVYAPLLARELAD